MWRIIIPPTPVLSPSPKSSLLLPSNSASLHERKTSTLSYPSPVSAPTSPDEIAEHLQPPQPSPVTINDQEEYKVEEILDSRFRWGKLWYLVKFVGWSNLDNMWLPHTEVHTPAVVKEFHLQYPDAPHTSSTSAPTHCKK